jgi:hypothetical protein
MHSMIPILSSAAKEVALRDSTAYLMGSFSKYSKLSTIHCGSLLLRRQENYNI